MIGHWHAQNKYFEMGRFTQKNKDVAVFHQSSHFGTIILLPKLSYGYLCKCHQDHGRGSHWFPAYPSISRYIIVDAQSRWYNPEVDEGNTGSPSIGWSAVKITELCLFPRQRCWSIRPELSGRPACDWFLILNVTVLSFFDYKWEGRLCKYLSIGEIPYGSTSYHDPTGVCLKLGYPNISWFKTFSSP